MNRSIQTVIIAPMITKSHDYPSRVRVTFKRKSGWIVLDQIRTVDIKRLTRKIGEVEPKTVDAMKAVIKEMLVD